MKAQMTGFIKGKLHTQCRPNLFVYCTMIKTKVAGREYTKETYPAGAVAVLSYFSFI